MPTVVIQHIETIWTKDSRGGNNARKRNAVPDALDLPAFVGDCQFALHHAKFDEHGLFVQQNRLITAHTFGELGLDFVSLTIDDDVLAVRFHRDGNNAATPSPFPHKDPFCVESGNGAEMSIMVDSPHGMMG